MIKINNIIMKISTLSIFLLFIACDKSNFEIITTENEYDLNVEKVEFERGVLLLNDKYCLSDIVAIKGMENSRPSDNSIQIWGVKKAGKPTISMIPAPYRLLKKRNTDLVYIFSYKDTIIAKLNH
jgi:hypothetical protein